MASFLQDYILCIHGNLKKNLKTRLDMMMVSSWTRIGFRNPKFSLAKPLIGIYNHSQVHLFFFAHFIALKVIESSPQRFSAESLPRNQVMWETNQSRELKCKLLIVLSDEMLMSPPQWLLFFYACLHLKSRIRISLKSFRRRRGWKFLWVSSVPEKHWRSSHLK